MNINRDRAFRYGLFVIGICAYGSPLMAQQPRLTPAAIGQIADEVFAELFPPGKAVSRVPVSRRGVLFDHARTLSSFGYSDALSVPLSALQLRTAVRSGTQSLFGDCSQGALLACRRLGWAVYVYIRPLVVTTSEARVRALVMWPDRGPESFQESAAPQGPALLVGYAQEIHVARSQDGKWKFVRRGPTMVF